MKVNVLKFSVILLAAALTLASCNRKGCTDPTALNYNEKAKKDDGNCEYAPIVTASETIVVSGSVATNTTWSAANIYELAGKVVVKSGATLTIEAGTVIKGRQGAGTLASSLVVSQG